MTNDSDFDNDLAYWDGYRWNAPAPVAFRSSHRVVRRNRTLPGLLMLIGVACYALAPSLSLVNLDLPAGSVAGIDVASQVDLGRLPADQLLLVRLHSVVGLACAALMLATRRWLWGPLLRLVFLGSMLYPATRCAYAWSLARQHHATPGVGLYLWTMGLMVCLLGLFLPAHSYQQAALR